MKTLLVVACALILALGASVFLFLGARSEPAQASAPSPAASELALLREQLARLSQRVDALAQPTRLESSGGARVSPSEIDAAVERALAQRGTAGNVPAADAVPAPAAGKQPKLTARAAFEELQEPGLDWEARRKLWSRLAADGTLDEVLALYEKAASENPGDPKAQTALGNAYLNKLFNSPQGPEAGIWGTKADKAFDRALALDDRNWEARFTKAVSLSNWPAFLGKQPEAIQHFEILVQQQSQGAVQPEFAQTYLILGNLYQQTGKLDKAVATWQQGQAMFPGMSEFQGKIQLAQQH